MVKTRNTRQKELIINEIGKFTGFFNIEELFKRISKKDSSIGIATVYRVLKNLRKRHELHPYTCDRKIIYSKEKKSHCHFKCEKCGKVNHIEIEKLDFLKNNVSGKICHFQIDVSGVCNNCSK